jgi:hypothetical protein
MIAKSKQARTVVEPHRPPMPFFRGSLTLSDPGDDNPQPVTIQLRVFKIDGENPSVPNPRQDAELQEAGWSHHAVGDLEISLRVVY